MNPRHNSSGARRADYTAGMSDDRAYLDQLQSWRRDAEADLRKPNGWLALAGLHWLSPGPHRLGSDLANDVVLPDSAPEYLGDLIVEASSVRIQIAPSVQVRIDGHIGHRARLRPDIDDEPSLLELGPLEMVVIKRGQRWGLRVWDNAREERDRFPGRRWYPADLNCRVEAGFEIPSGEATITVPNETGVSTEEPVAGVVSFRLNGQLARLIALPRGGERLFLIFSDSTNGKTTYKPGRFLVAGPPTGGQLTLDFNYAYNPPCAFTEFATCSLPPPENRLDIAIQAGEKAPDL